MGNKNINIKTSKGTNMSTVGVDIGDWIYEKKVRNHSSHGPVIFRYQLYYNIIIEKKFKVLKILLLFEIGLGILEDNGNIMQLISIFCPNEVYI